MLKRLLSSMFMVIPIQSKAVDIYPEVPGKILWTQKDLMTEYGLSQNSLDWVVMQPNCNYDLGCRLYYQWDKSSEAILFNIEETLCSTDFELGALYNGLWYGVNYLTGWEYQIKDYELLSMLVVAANCEYKQVSNPVSYVTPAWPLNYLWLESQLTTENIVKAFTTTYPFCKYLYLSAPTLTLASEIGGGELEQDLISLLNGAGIEVNLLYIDGRTKTTKTVGKRHFYRTGYLNKYGNGPI